MFWKQINQSAKFREEIVDKTAKEIEKKKRKKEKKIREKKCMSKKVQAETFNLPEKKRKSYKCRTRKRSTEVNRKKYIYKHTKKKDRKSWHFKNTLGLKLFYF